MSEQTLTSAAATRGPLAMEAISVSKDFRIGRGHTLHAVRDVSFNLYRGAVVALVGESGSGKSTAARLLAGQERLTSGAIRLDGKQVDVSSRKAFRRYKSEVQLVFQDPFASLNPVHTVRYHLERPVKLHQGAANVNSEVTALLEQVRLTPARHFLAKYPHELSGGQRQRVSFARALAARPSVLLADEPVSMLDVSIRLEMLGLLDDLRRRFRLAMLYITHDIASARYFADEVLVMYAGEIVERGPAEDVTQLPAHPYTQLLVAAAPDPDNLGSALRGGGRRRGLATSYAWSNGGKAISFTIRQGVKWNNGTPFTPDDVVFTFNMVKNNTAVNLDGLKISSVSASGNTVTLTFPTPQYTNLEEIAGTAIVPKAIWSTVGNPSTFTDANPVGTGPYMLGSFTPQGYTLKKNPSYWQAADVQVPNVYFPVYTSNTSALSALFAGQIDWTGNFIPGLQKNFVDTNPNFHHFWEAPGGTNSLMPNLNKWPTNQLAVRQAISLGLTPPSH